MANKADKPSAQLRGGFTKRGITILRTEAVVICLLVVLAVVHHFPHEILKTERPPENLSSGGTVMQSGAVNAAGITFPEQEAVSPSSATDTTTTQFVQSDDWRLILVNSEYPLPEDYTVQLKKLRNDFKVDKRIYPDLQAMFDAARAQGIYPLIQSAYRTAEFQQTLLDNKLSELAEQGITGDAAMENALSWVAAPRTSEHQLGMAIDITVEGTACTLDEVYRWMEDNSWRYGFIRRYPEDKLSITGINYEPWHFRYVGREHAAAIYEKGICLEEYVGAVGITSGD